MDFKCQNSRRGVDRNYIFERNQKISVEDRGDVLIKKTQLRELFLCNISKQKSQKALSNTDNQIIAAKIQVNDINKKIEREINKLQNFRYLYLDELGNKSKQRKQAKMQETEKHLTWSQKLSNKKSPNSNDENPAPGHNQRKPPDLTKSYKQSELGFPISTEKYRNLTKKVNSNSPELSPNQRQTSSHSLSKKPALITIPVSPASNQQTNSPNQQQTKARSLFKNQHLINIKKSHVLSPHTTRMPIIPENPPKLPSKKDLPSTNNSQESVKIKSTSSPKSEEADVCTNNVVKSSHSSNDDDEKLFAVSKSSQDTYQREEKQAKSKRIPGGCNCNNNFYNYFPRLLYYCQRCNQNVCDYNNIPATMSAPCLPHPSYQQKEPSCSRQRTDLNTDEMIRDFSVKPETNRNKTKHTDVSRNSSSPSQVRSTDKSKPKTVTHSQKLQDQDTDRSLSSHESVNTRWAKTKLTREKPIITRYVPRKKTIPNDEQKRLHLEYMAKYKEEQEKTLNMVSSKTTSDLQTYPTYTRLPLKQEPEPESTTEFLHRTLVGKQESSIQQNDGGEYDINGQRNYVPVKELLILENDNDNQYQHLEPKILQKSESRFMFPDIPKLLSENEAKELCLPDGKGTDQNEKPSYSKTADFGQMSTHNLQTLSEHSPIQMSQQQIITKTESNPGNESDAGYFEASSKKGRHEQTRLQQMTRIPILIKAEKNVKSLDSDKERHLQTLPVKLEVEQTTELSAVQQASAHHSNIIKPEEHNLPETQTVQYRADSRDTSPKIDQQRSMLLLQSAHSVTHSHSNFKYQQKAESTVKAINFSISKTQLFDPCMCPAATFNPEIDSKEKQPALRDPSPERKRNVPFQLKPCMCAVSKYNKLTINNKSAGQRLDKYEYNESTIHCASCDLSLQDDSQAARVQRCYTKLQNAQREYDAIMASTSNTLTPTQADSQVSVSDRTGNRSLNSDLSTSIESTKCEPKRKEKKDQRQPETQSQLLQEPYNQQSSHKTPNNSTVCQRTMHLITFEDKNGQRETINTPVCHRNNIDWELLNEPIVVRKEDYAPQKNDDYDDVNTFNETCVSSSTAEFTCNESNFDDDYATCDESQTENEDSNEVPSFSGCPCMYDEFLKFAGLYMPNAEAKAKSVTNGK